MMTWFSNFAPVAETVPSYLHTAGYRTGFYGKFLNGFPILSDQPCLTDYAINRGQQHAGLPVSVNGTLARPSGWLDEFGLRRAKRFLGRVAPKKAPWYVYFSDSYPHSPYVPRPKYAKETIIPPPGTEGPALTRPTRPTSRRSSRPTSATFQIPIRSSRTSCECCAPWMTTSPR